MVQSFGVRLDRMKTYVYCNQDTGFEVVTQEYEEKKARNRAIMLASTENPNLTLIEVY